MKHEHQDTKLFILVCNLMEMDIRMFVYVCVLGCVLSCWFSFSFHCYITFHDECGLHLLCKTVTLRVLFYQEKDLLVSKHIKD